ncbi:MAG: VWA domain-containing protein [Acidobacteria bacterium]|nr:MAG: VWA domain-containing protein [Acidobacteriota bacterium]
MFFEKFARQFRQIPYELAAILLILALGALAPLFGQNQQPQQAPANTQQNPNTQTPPPEAGGPGGDVGPYAVPKKKEEPPPPPPEKPKKIEGMPDYSINVDVPLVNVDVSVLTKNGQFVPGLKKDNFRVLEDGVPQKITNFAQAEAPITAVMLVEFASTNYYFLYDALNASYNFANSLKKDDWIAVEYYDMKPHILVDFTQDKRAIMGALNSLRIPTFSETNLFDALYDTMDRLDRVEGRKYIILISSGVDTFSKLNLDQMLKKVKATHNITIYAVSIGRAVREYYEAHGATLPHGLAPIQNIDYLQADNEMNTFARLTGGRAYFPRFEGELPEIFHDVAADIRNQYNLAYHPTNPKLDGTYRKLKVELVAPEGGPLKVKDQKGKDVKIQIIAREGYTAKHTVE